MSYVDFYFTEMGRKILEIEAGYIAEKVVGNMILSVGCGPGIMEERVKHLTGAEVVCADHDIEMLSQYRGAVEKILCKAEKLPFRNESFDDVVFVTSLEFMDCYKDALAEAHRVLKRDGKLLALMLNRESEYFREKMKKKDSYIVRNIKHPDTSAIEREIERLYQLLSREFIVAVRGEKVLQRGSRDDAAIISIEGVKR